MNYINDPTSISDFSKIKHLIYMECVPADNDFLQQADIAHKIVGNIAITYRVCIEIDADRIISAAVTNTYLENRGLTVDDVHDLAIKNSPHLFPAKLETMEEFLDQPADVTCSEKEQLYIIHTYQSPNGGTRAVFYPGVLKDFATKLESNLIIVPASTDESILIADTGDVDIDAIHDVLVSANDEHIAEVDGAFLSDSMYYFDLETCGLFQIENESHSEQMFS